MGKKKWFGSFAIPMTPFDDNDRVDEDVLAAEIEFLCESEVGCIVSPVMVSEFRSLSEDERRTLIRVPVEVSAGRVPVVGSCSAVNTPLAVSYAEYAQKVGADMVVAMPPYIRPPDYPAMKAYYQAISDAIDIPIMIQNASVAAVSLDQVCELCTEIEHVSWIKEEVPFEPRRIADLVRRNCEHLKGVVGGGGGRYSITEWQRGALGTVHACQYADVVQKVWDLLDAGEMAEAEDLFDKLLPGIVIEGFFGMTYAKEVMIRRGVFKNNRVRGLTKPLTDDDMIEITRVYERLEPYFEWHKS